MLLSAYRTGSKKHAHSSAVSCFLCFGLRVCALGSMGRPGFGLPTRSRAMALISLFTSNFLRFIALR
jgi:hypothetical protein